MLGRSLRLCVALTPADSSCVCDCAMAVSPDSHTVCDPTAPVPSSEGIDVTTIADSSGGVAGVRPFPPQKAKAPRRTHCAGTLQMLLLQQLQPREQCSSIMERVLRAWSRPAPRDAPPRHLAVDLSSSPASPAANFEFWALPGDLGAVMGWLYTTQSERRKQKRGTKMDDGEDLLPSTDTKQQQQQSGAHTLHPKLWLALGVCYISLGEFVQLSRPLWSAAALCHRWPPSPPPPPHLPPLLLRCRHCGALAAPYICLRGSPCCASTMPAPSSALPSLLGSLPS